VLGVTLQALKESFAEQPNWKAAVMGATTWEGNADENGYRLPSLELDCIIIIIIISPY